jgi:2-C-methyl-D-erythritol 4-phosphate cytidylyltransferase
VSTAAILVAAGSGERLGAGVPKALVALGGQPMVVRAAAAFVAATTIQQIVVVAPPDCVDRLARDLGEGIAVVAGGPSRQQSVSAGLDALSGDVRVVAVHDGARPLVTPQLIDRTVAALVPPWDAVAPALAVVDTIKRVDSRGTVLRTVDRNGLWAVQTPQVSSRATLERVHARVASGVGAATDDLSLVERAGGRVLLIEGDPVNFKITHPEDLAMAQRLVAGQ